MLTTPTKIMKFNLPLSDTLVRVFAQSGSVLLYLGICMHKAFLFIGPNTL